MTAPVRVDPGITYLITRRIILRHNLLRPDGTISQIFRYLLAVSAAAYGIEVHAFCVMSDHIHLVATDVRGTLPQFTEFFHRMTALCTKAHHGWSGPIWDKSPVSSVRLETPAAVVEKIAYTLANPVNAGLVRHAHQWPGAKVLIADLGTATLKTPRPKPFLNPDNWPAEASLPITLPPGVDPDNACAFREQVAAELSRLETAAHARMTEERRSFLGPQRAGLVPPTSRATTPEPAVKRNPTFAVGRGQGDAWIRATEALQSFRLAYRSALMRWRERIRDAVFPAGTWAMKVYHSAVVSPLSGPHTTPLRPRPDERIPEPIAALAVEPVIR